MRRNYKSYMQWMNESTSLSPKNAKRLHEEDEERKAEQEAIEDDDFDAEDVEMPEDDLEDADAPEGFDFEDDDFEFEVEDDEDEDIDIDVEDVEGEDDVEFDGDYNCESIAAAVQDIREQVSAIKNLSIKSFIGSVEVEGCRVDFRAKTTDGEITDMTIDNIIQISEIENSNAAIEEINSILSGEDIEEDDELSNIEIEDDELDESFGF